MNCWAATAYFVLAACASGAEPIEPLLKVAAGFAVERVYVVPREEQGSWVSLCADRRGKLFASDQYGPLYEISFDSAGAASVRSLKLRIGGVHGMTWVGDELFAVVGQREVCQPGLYRLRDADGDGQLDEVRLLRAIEGDGEHGPHAVIASADGQSLLIMAGNASPLPSLARSRVPQIWREDSLLPPLPALIGSETRGQAHGGWICRTDREGKEWELVCMGFRNAYALATDRAGEVFTFDSDTEFEIGMPWYRSTRVLHCVGGADFGWRRGALKIPDGAPELPPALVSMGLGSPTAVLFGSGAAFPPRYQEALFVADWCFGRLCAVHLRQRGAGFAAESEEVVTGTPLPIAAACVSPRDGAMYFVTGGRKTQSAVYRLSWRGPDSAQDVEASRGGGDAIGQRLALEALHGRGSEGAIDRVWQGLGNDDVWVRHAARIALEWQPIPQWQDRALSERQPRAALTALLALVRTGDANVQLKVLTALEAMDWESLDQKRSDWMHVVWLAFARGGGATAEVRQRWREILGPRYPTGQQALDGPLCELLVFLEMPEIAVKGMAQLTDEYAHERQLHVGRCLSVLETGWNPELRGAFFDWLGRASGWRGGASFNAFLQRYRSDALARVPAERREGFRQRMEAAMPRQTTTSLAVSRPHIKPWVLDELIGLAEQSKNSGDAARGRKLFAVAGCAACHTFAGEGGAVGSDLTAVARRLSTRELVEAIVDPSKEISDQYASVIVARRDGSQVTGRVVNFNSGAIHLLENLFDPSAITKVPEADVESIMRSKVSLMPAGLLNVLSAEEILDLLTYLKGGLVSP